MMGTTHGNNNIYCVQNMDGLDRESHAECVLVFGDDGFVESISQLIYRLKWQINAWKRHPVHVLNRANAER